MEKSTKLVGFLAFGLMAYFLFKSKDETDDNKAPLEGLNISVNPDKIVDSVMPFIDMPEPYKSSLKRGVKKAINGFMSEKRKERDDA